MMTRLDQPHLPRCMCEDKQAGFPHIHGSQLGWREIGYQITSCVFFFNLYIWKMQFSQPGFIVSWKTCLNDVWSLVRSNLILKNERADPNWLLIVKFTAPGNPRALCNIIRVASFILPKKIIWKKTLNYLQTTVASGKSHPLWQTGWPPR